MSQCTTINPKWIKDLNIRFEAVHYTEENIGTKIMSLGCGEHFMNLTPKAEEVKAKISEWDYKNSYNSTSNKQSY